MVPAYRILSIVVFAILYAYTAIVVFILIVLSWFRAGGLVRLISRGWAKSVFMLMFKRLPVTGRENIKKEEKYILIANHASLFDIVAIMSFYPGISWFGHERLLRVPVFSHFLKLTGYVPFKEPTVSNTRRMLEHLMENSLNRSVALFPEGTRTTDGKINSFYRGFIYLFRSRDINILPVTLNGFYKLKPKNRSYINFGSRLGVVIHTPIPKEELVNMNDHQIIETVKTVIESSYQ
jgi:1-acyl-sn-glycerol-3-phosphate acyltransferase